MCRFLFVTRPLIVTAPGPTNARASTVPAAFGTPVPAAYGVHSDVHRAAPTGGVKTPLTVNVADSSCAPNGERPGEPWGVSAGARQTVSFAEPSAVSEPDVGFT